MFLINVNDLNNDQLELLSRAKLVETDTKQIIRVVGASKADKRWLAIAKTHFEEGFMALTRSVTET